MSGSGPIETIHVGVKYSFSMVTRDGSNFAVYERKRCDGSGIVDYAIARMPSDISSREDPGSVLEAFPDRETAVLAFGRWIARPKLENRSRQVTRRMQRKKHFAAQLGMDLGPMQTKEQIELAAAERRQERYFGKSQSF